MNEKDVVFCTVIARNYLAQAKVLAKSIAKYHPEAEINILIVDNLNKKSYNNELFQTTTLKDVKIPDVEQLAFKYNITEFSTAVKPFYLEYLFKKRDGEKVIFLDPDIKLYGPLKEAIKLLNTKDIILTPHITTPYTDRKQPSEITLLKSGPYNLGFVGLKKSKNTFSFLTWWQEKLRWYCFEKRGFFVDQKWISLAISLFDNIKILKHPGYNVAYWNLHERKITKIKNKYYVNNKPLRFYHFSGFYPTLAQFISKHQNRFLLHQLNDETQKLFLTYEKELLAEQYNTITKYPYGFGTYSNGKKIIQPERYLFSLQKKKFSQPFSTKRKSFYRYVRRGFFLKDIIWLGWKTIIFRTGFIFLNHVLPKLTGNVFSSRVKNWLKKTTQYNNIFGTMYAQQKAPFGVNILGYHTTESGMGESVRTLTKTIRQARIPFLLNNDTSTYSRQQETEFRDYFKDYNKYNINIVVINGDQFKRVVKHIGKNYFDNKHTIAYWTWELNKFPKNWPVHHPLIDEFWVPSQFVKKALEKRTTKKITVIPHSITTYSKKKDARNKKFTFLFMFDFYSFFERKNPLGVVRAFKKAFGESSQVKLIIKCINKTYNPQAFKYLQQETKQNNIELIDNYFTRTKLNKLMDNCDCYVSLHRSEGFGLTIAEAMAKAKPVIVTAYSGNMDFCNVENSYLVPYTLVKIKTNQGPYKKGNKWAQPDITVAARHMQNIFRYQQEAKKKGRKAAKTIRENFSAELIGKQVKQLLEEK